MQSFNENVIQGVASQGVSIKNYEPRIEKSDWSIQIVVVEVQLILETRSA